MTWIVENWDSLMAILTGIHMIALTVINLTRKPQDPHSPAGRGYRALELTAGLVTEKSKQ